MWNTRPPAAAHRFAKPHFMELNPKYCWERIAYWGREIVQARMPCAIAVLPASMLATAGPGEAAGTSVRARFSFDAVANCEKPAVQNYPVHAEGTGVLSTDRTATLNMNSNVEGRVRYNAKLGAKPTEAIGGSALLRVAGRDTLPGGM